MKHKIASRSILCRAPSICARTHACDGQIRRSIIFGKGRAFTDLATGETIDSYYAKFSKQKASSRDNVEARVSKLRSTVPMSKKRLDKEAGTRTVHYHRVAQPRSAEHPPQENRPKTMTGREVSQKLFNEDGTCNLAPTYLRDACDCSLCVDTSTRQRNFSFAQIPPHVKPILERIDENHVYHVSWKKDVPGFDESHMSTFPASRVEELASSWTNSTINSRKRRPLWDQARFQSIGCWAEYNDYIKDEATLRSTVLALHRDGLVFIKNVPSEPSAVAAIAERIGPLRNTFYGPTWDVRSIANAKNVAYTSKYLGFHMDLLYMATPPDYQLLHCLQNSCAGGESRFVDTFLAAQILASEHPEYYAVLSQFLVRYTYDNDGHYYSRTRKIIDLYGHRSRSAPKMVARTDRVPDSVNWSPEFMGVPGMPNLLKDSERRSEEFIDAARTFAKILEREDLVYQVKMDEGTCVIFENRRVAHARNAFEMKSGQRWLRGAYLDLDTFLSRYKVLRLADEEAARSTEDAPTEEMEAMTSEDKPVWKPTVRQHRPFAYAKSIQDLVNS